MDTTIILVLAIILGALFVLNNIKLVNTTTTEDEHLASCSQTPFGCCPNGVDSKIDFYGTNCPAYNPIPGLSPVVTPTVVVGNPMLPAANNNTTVVVTNPPVVRPARPVGSLAPIGGCAGTRYGCCADNQTQKRDAIGSNCLV